MAVLPVKWNWEDALDKKNQKEHDGSSTYIILESLSDNISEKDSLFLTKNLSRICNLQSSFEAHPTLPG